MKYYMTREVCWWLLAGIAMLLIVSSCAPVPVIPEGMILLPKKEVNKLLDKYTQQQEQLKELQDLRAWKDEMFF